MKYTYNIGQRLNRLTITGDFYNQYNQKQIMCACDCGKIVTVMPYNLFNNKTKSCGCHKKDMNKLNRKYLVGDKIGMLTLIKELPKINKRRFLVECECGNTKEITLHYGIKSCGCKKRQSKDCDATEYKRYIKTSNKRCIPILLTKEKFSELIHKNCYYCNRIPHMKMHVGKQLRNGIDRVNNDEGYTVDNSITCCAYCNFAKRNLSFTDFIKLVRDIYNHRLKDSCFILDFQTFS